VLDDKACEILVSVGYLLFFPKLHDLAAQNPHMASGVASLRNLQQLLGRLETLEKKRSSWTPDEAQSIMQVEAAYKYISLVQNHNEDIRQIAALCLRQCIEVRYSDEYVRPLTVLSFWDPLLAMQEWPKWIWKERSSRQRADEERRLKKQLKEYIAACNNCTTSPLLHDMGANTEGR